MPKEKPGDLLRAIRLVVVYRLSQGFREAAGLFQSNPTAQATPSSLREA